MTQPDAMVLLDRAYRLLKEVETKTEGFRETVAAHDAALDSTNKPFLEIMWKGVTGKRRLGAEKAELFRDLQLAASEVDKAASLDPEVRIETADGPFNPTNMRAGIWLLYGQVELASGTLQTARQYLLTSVQTFELPETYFMLGLVCESQYDIQTALGYYEKYLDLSPSGEFSVSALRSASALRNYRKRFRGDWTLLVISFIGCFPIALIYFFVKYK